MPASATKWPNLLTPAHCCCGFAAWACLLPEELSACRCRSPLLFLHLLIASVAVLALDLLTAGSWMVKQHSKVCPDCGAAHAAGDVLDLAACQDKFVPTRHAATTSRAHLSAVMARSSPPCQVSQPRSLVALRNGELTITSRFPPRLAENLHSRCPAAAKSSIMKPSKGSRIMCCKHESSHSTSMITPFTSP